MSRFPGDSSKGMGIYPKPSTFKSSRRDRRSSGCQMQAAVLTVLAPIAIPVIVARTAWLRKKGRID